MPKPYSRKDSLVIVACIVMIWLIVQFWLPLASTTPLVGYQFHISLGIVGMGVIFLALSMYGVARFSPPKQRWLVLGLVALPAIYAGMLAGSLRHLDRHDAMANFAGGVRSQDGLAALWWGKQAALDLPSWSRGGVEPWPTMSGDLLVSTHEDHVEVSLAAERASPRECLRLLSDFTEQKSLLETVDGWVSIDGSRFKGDPETACRNGGIMALMAKLPAED